jgi:hypothetical protein
MQQTPARFVAEIQSARMRERSSRCDRTAGRYQIVEITLLRADGSREVLLWMKDAHQPWPTPYVFKTPVPARGIDAARGCYYRPSTSRHRRTSFSVRQSIPIESEYGDDRRHLHCRA